MNVLTQLSSSELLICQTGNAKTYRKRNVLVTDNKVQQGNQTF